MTLTLRGEEDMDHRPDPTRVLLCHIANSAYQRFRRRESTVDSRPWGHLADGHSVGQTYITHPSE
jgi:hypothetical protein